MTRRTLNQKLDEIMHTAVITDDMMKELDAITAKMVATPPYVPLVDKPPTPGALRKKYPALQDAWEQYQMVLTLVREQDK